MKGEEDMKKNIFTIIIMALSCINVILTAVVVFTMVPAMNRTNNLVSQISQMVDLELEASEKDKNAVVSVYDTEPHVFKSTTEKTITINLAAGEDGKQHYAVFDSVTITVNKKADDYKELAAIIDTRNSEVMKKISEVVRVYDYETILVNQGQLTNDCIKKMQEYFETEAITDVSIDGLIFQ
jgi:flagellar FliL protein